MTARKRVAVLASGGGSNLQAVIDHLAALGGRRSADVVLVVAGRESAGALARARRGAIATAVTAPDSLAEILDRHAIDLVVLAGYLSFVPVAVTERWAGRIINVHPALLPSFGGHGLFGGRVHRAVLAAGVRVSGATVHFVDAEYDRGPIIAQWPVPVAAGDTPESLAARVLRVEHLLLPRAVDALARGAVSLGADGRVRGGAAIAPMGPFTFHPSDDATLVAEIDALFPA
ncbi:MAG TPA: phosphoribosylglycinamide formyltransferase [Gemmatimonadaceae bacterium]|nr:phosphoribosylglycinamide formyltransferase [Gemmatimonadaceae bacterium]